MTEAVSDTRGGILVGKYLDGASAKHKIEVNLLNLWKLQRTRVAKMEAYHARRASVQLHN